MAKDTEVQGIFLKKVVNITEIRPKDKTSGQQKLFGTVEEFAPGFAEWASQMNGRLANTEKQNEKLIEQLEASAAKSDRLASSLESVIPKLIDQSTGKDNPDLVVGIMKNGEKADVATLDSTNILAESVYTLTTGDIAEAVGNNKLTASLMGGILKKLGIFGDRKFHHTNRTGKKSHCQKYKPSVIEEIYKRLADPEQYNLDLLKVTKAINYIRPQGAVSE